MRVSLHPAVESASASRARESDLRTMAHEAGEEVPGDPTKAEASERIDELREETGRRWGGRGRGAFYRLSSCPNG